METQPVQEKSVDEVLGQVDWEKLGAEGGEDQPQPVVPAMPEPPPEAKLELAPPAHTKLFHHGSDIEIVRRWFRWMTVLVTGFALLLDLVLFSTFTNMMEDNLARGMLVLATGVALTYYAIAGWLNRTRILVSHDKITVRHGPLPWIGNTEVDATNVKQVLRVEKETRGRHGRHATYYELYAFTHDGRDVKLVDGSTGMTGEQAGYIAMQIEKYLGIEYTPKGGRLFAFLE